MQTVRTPLQVVVVADRCTDDTAAVARRFAPAFASRGIELLVIEATRSGLHDWPKSAALNVGDAAARHGHRLYLDADIELSAGALESIARAFSRGVLFCAPRKVTEGAFYSSRAYGRLWSAVPCVRDDVIGAGAYAVHGYGRRRWGSFPDVISDDKYARLQFSRAERAVLDDATFSIQMPAGFRELVAVRARWLRGNRQLRERFPELAANDRRRRREAAAFVLKSPRSWSDLPIVMAMYVCAELYGLRGRRVESVRWERATRARKLWGAEGRTTVGCP